MTNIARGGVEYFEGSISAGAEFLLLGAGEECDKLEIIDHAKSFEDAKTKAELFLDDHPNGGILILKHLVAAYRMPVFEKIQH